MTIDQLTERRRNMLHSLIENEALFGFKRLLTDLYPDNAHFIYELLQNAEDAKASEVRFTLNPYSVEFEHDGTELFTLEDVESITNIGSSTKADNLTKIGKFGVGFKAVFAYTATPEIESGLFHFRIREMVVPDTEGLSPGILGERKTRFVFPFDNPEKPPEKARAEIEKHLRELNENTLLFLSNIRKIEYRLPDATEGFLERRETADDEHQIEIAVMRQGRTVPESVHYLRFEKVVSVKDEDDSKRKSCRIAVAFGLEPQDQGWKIAPLYLGQVCIYFPAVKETSNLRFHLHAPFASTVARDSVRDCSANDELRNHLAELVAESMHAIREQGLLNVEFLAALPNSRDNLSSFYLPIRDQLIQEFNQEKLTPMKRGGHAAAVTCYRGRRDLSNLINDEDLATLLGENPALPLWIANPPQINQPEDNFLSMLDISEWEIEDLVEELQSPTDSVMEWLKGKSDEWHQELYVLLGEYLSSAPSYPIYVSEERKRKLSNLPIVRCSDDEYRIGDECHFPTDDRESDEILSSAATALEEESQSGNQEDERGEDFNYVARGVYSSGRNGAQKKAREFLVEIGVAEINEAERIKVVLKQRYSRPIRPRLKDMTRFLAFFQKEPDEVSLFSRYFIFKTNKDLDNKSWWSSPSGVFLDSPYLDTGLSVYYDALSDDTTPRKWALSPAYMESGIDPEVLGEFAAAVGAQTKLVANEQNIPSTHPDSEYLRQAQGQWRWDTGVDKDYTIPNLPILLNGPSIDKSRLIWQTMHSLPEHCLKARYRKNRSYDAREADSTLVYELREAKWVPQEGETISFVSPPDASINSLPGGFLHDTGEKWLKAIRFGENAESAKRDEENRDQRAQEWGFNSDDEATKAAELVQLLKEKGKSPEAELAKLKSRKRREERLIIELGDAPEREYERRLRSVRITQGRIGPRTYLRGHYAQDGTMECQMCRRPEMPFKKRDSDDDYFIAVEALRIEHFPKEHEAQYLALCPECSEMYKEFVKRSASARKTLYNLLKTSEEPEVRLESHGHVIRLWFEDKHWQDLRTVIEYYENEYNAEDSTD